jgi:hypothetical protein
VTSSPLVDGFLDGEPAGFARSRHPALAGVQLEVDMVGYSDVAGNVADCVQWGRQNTPDGAQARLLHLLGT